MPNGQSIIAPSNLFMNKQVAREREREREREEREGNEREGSLKYTCLHASVKCYSSSSDTSAHQFDNVLGGRRVINYVRRVKHRKWDRGNIHSLVVEMRTYFKTIPQ